MCLCLTNPKLHCSEQAVVLNICKITEPKKNINKIYLYLWMPEEHNIL